MLGIPRRGAPPLYRLARALRVLGALVVLGLVSYVGLAAYSGAAFHPNGSWNGSWADFNFTGSSIVANTTLAVSNPGYFGLGATVIRGTTLLPNGTFLAEFDSPSLSIPARSNATVPLTLTLPLSNPATGRTLLTQDLVLPSFVNVSSVYADLFPIVLSVERNMTWGAPFFGYNGTVGSPQPGPNGTVVVSVTLSWSNHSPIAEAGTLDFSVRSVSGATCGSGSLPVSDPAGGTFDRTLSVSLAAGCDPAGGSVTSDFSFAGAFSFPLPRIPIP